MLPSDESLTSFFKSRIAGRRRKSNIMAKIIAKIVISPISTFNLNEELVRTPKPTARINVLITIAIPTLSKAYRIESSTLSWRSSLARTYFERKCTVSSTTIPSEIDATVATEKPTSPTNIAQAPKVAAQTSRRLRQQASS